MENTITSHITKGAIIAVPLIALDLVAQKAGASLPPIVAYLPLMLLPAGVAISCIVFVRQMGGPLKFGDTFAHGFKTTAVVAFIMAVYTWIAVKYIYAPPTEADIQLAFKTIQAQGNVMADEARKQALDAAKNRWIIYVGRIIFVSIISGLVGSLIGALVANTNVLAKKKP